MALSSTKIVKVIVVTDDLDRTASAYRTLLGVEREPEPGDIGRQARLSFPADDGRAGG